MKGFKKLIVLMLAVAMTLAMTVTAFADGTNATISTASGDDHTYNVYQILTGTVESDGTLKGIGWGSNANKEAADTAAAAAEAIQKACENLTGNKEIRAEVVKYVNLESTPAYTVSASKSATVPTGYYLIQDTATEGEISYDIISVAKDIEIQRKAGTPTFEKKIKDTNDTTGETSDWQDSADYDIGDAIPFQLKATVADDYDNYTVYKLAFHDVEEAGLTFNKESVVVKIGDVTVDSLKYTLNENTSDGCTFEVVFDDLKSLTAYEGTIKAGTVITVDYTATLNDDAVIGEQGNVNKAKLEYSNNPNSTQSGEGTPTNETPWDNVIVFTYQTIINKVDDNNQPLTGAEFTLEKVVKDGENVKVSCVTATSGSTFTFKGLDDGQYILTETKTPAGYTGIKPVTFNVTADHKIEWTSEDRTDVLTSLNGAVDSASEGTITLKAEKAAGSLTSDVQNTSASSLPSTGGMGTTLLYVIGILLVLASVAGFVLYRRKRA